MLDLMTFHKRFAIFSIRFRCDVFPCNVLLESVLTQTMVPQIQMATPVQSMPPFQAIVATCSMMIQTSHWMPCVASVVAVRCRVPAQAIALLGMYAITMCARCYHLEL